MNKKRNNKTVKDGQTPAPVSAASAPSEHYERRDGVGFVLVKQTKSGVTEIPLSNFTASILTETRSEDTRVEGFTVEVLYRDCRSVFNIPALDPAPIQFKRTFDDRLLSACLKVHPLASVMPNKTAHVLSAIKQLSAPQVIVKKSEAEQSKQGLNQPINKLNRR